MNNTITNEQAEKALLAFFWVDEEDNDTYKDFRTQFDFSLSLVAHKHLGWSNGISTLGYQQIVLAYNELAKTDFLDDYTDEELDKVVATFALSRNTVR